MLQVVNLVHAPSPLADATHRETRAAARAPAAADWLIHPRLNQGRRSMKDDRFRTNLPHLTEFNAFLEELNKESDRGAALISTAMLDDLLEKTILSFLLENNDTKRLLSGFNAPLGTFSSRILAAYSLGLISEEEYDECNWLRAVRNEFAHRVHKEFGDEKVKDLCANLRFAAKQIIKHPNIPRAQFLTSATALILHLTNRPHYVSQKRLKYEPWK
jgi:mannitol operon repressor